MACAGIDHCYPALIEIVRRSRPVFNIAIIRLLFKDIKYQRRPNERYKYRIPGVYSLCFFVKSVVLPILIIVYMARKA